MTNEPPVRTEEFRLSGEAVVTKIRELIREGNARRIIVKNEEGHTIFEVPLTAGMAVGAATIWLFPLWAAIGAVAALATRLTIVVERVDRPKE